MTFSDSKRLCIYWQCSTFNDKPPERRRPKTMFHVTPRDLLLLWRKEGKPINFHISLESFHVTINNVTKLPDSLPHELHNHQPVCATPGGPAAGCPQSCANHCLLCFRGAQTLWLLEPYKTQTAAGYFTFSGLLKVSDINPNILIWQWIKELA